MASLSRAARLYLILATVLAATGCNRQDSAERDRQVATAWLSAHPTPKGLPTLAPLLAWVSPAVVNISVQGTVPIENPPYRNPRFRQYNSRPQQLHPQRFWDVGSGVIIDGSRGYIVTNNHVVKNAQRIEVTLSDRRERQAKLVAADPQTDIAIVKIDADGLKDIALGTSSDLRVGDFVVAIGDPYGVGQTTTFGVVSALGRTDLGIEIYEDFIQTDASINPGNSGGALVNMAGQLVGMNTAIISGTSSGGSVGVGFAIPVDMVRMIARALIQSGKLTRGSLGVVVQDLTPAIASALEVRISAGALVSQVNRASPAEKAGIKSGDVITRMGGMAIGNSNNFRVAVSEEPPGTVVRLAFLRNDREQTANATLVALEEPVAQSIAPPPETTGPLSGTKTGAIPRTDPNRAKLKGVYVSDVAPESTAAAGGLRPGDIILDADRRPVTSAAQLQNVVNAHPASRPLLLRVARDRYIIFLAIG